MRGRIGGTIPLTIVDFSSETDSQKKEATAKPGTAVSPLEYALFLQAALGSFKPTVDRPLSRSCSGTVPAKNMREQILIDQVMRVPKARGRGGNSRPHRTSTRRLLKIPGFTQVTGRRGDFAMRSFQESAGNRTRHIRLISTLGFINLPNDFSLDEIHVPLLFQIPGRSHSIVPAAGGSFLDANFA